MPNYDDRTQSGWPLPFRSNTLEFDVERLRETFLAVDEALSSLRESFRVLLDEKFYGLEEKQYILDERMDVIAGQTTEDSEILDARVGGDGAVHPCLGEHIRSVYGVVVQAVRDIEYGIDEFAGLLRQFNSLAEAQLQDQLNSNDAHERRKLEISQTNERLDEEVLDRQEGDSALHEELTHERQQRYNEDAHLQEQADILSEASIRHSLNLEQEAQRRREGFEAAEREAAIFRAGMRQALFDLDYGVMKRFTETEDKIYAETEARSTRDEALQAALDEEVLARKNSDAEISQERRIRDQQDDGLQRQINETAQAILQSAVNLQQLSQRCRELLKQEIQARLSGDEALQEQVSRNAREIQREADQRAEIDAELHEALDVVNEEVGRHEVEISSEGQARIEADKGLARQADTNAEAAIRTTLTVQDLNARRKADLLHEAQERITRDSALQTQTDSNAAAIRELRTDLSHEAQELDRVNETLNAEISLERQVHAQQGRELQHQADTNAEAAIRTAFNLQDLNNRRKADLTRETQARIAGDADLRDALAREEQSRRNEDFHQQTQIDTNASANMRNSLNIQQEARERRNLLARLLELRQGTNSQIQSLRNEMGLLYEIPLPGLSEQLSGLQSQADMNAQGSITNTLNLSREAEHRRGVSEALSEEVSQRIEAVNLERAARFEEDAHLQEQVDMTAQGVLGLVGALSHEAEQRRALAGVVAGIKSPVDWSNAETLAISEPRCAIVNFSGLASMPTSKTVDIPAVLEFWDLQGNYFKKPIVCSAQGSSSMGYVKKNVKVDLLNEDGSEFDLKIGNWVAQDGFHLKAYYTDFFRGIGVTSYKFWDEVMRFNGLDKDRPYKKVMIDASSIHPSGTDLNNPEDFTLQFDTGALCHPDGFPCIVYLNGTFYGVFSWQLKKHRKNYRMDKGTVEHIHLDGSLNASTFFGGSINWTVFEVRNPNKLYTMDGKKYDGDAPQELIDETSEKFDPTNKDHVRTARVKGYILDLVNRFNEFKQAPTREGYEALFDWENQRDYLIFSDIVSNRDGFSKNWQWTTYDGVKWFVNAYDLDMTYGGMHNGSQITAPLTGHVTTSKDLPTYYVALLYEDELEMRYRELRDAGIISVDNIIAKLADWTARIGVGNYELEYQRWPSSPCILNYTDSVYRVRKWLEVEISNMDKVYNYDTQPEIIVEEPDNEPEARAQEVAGLARQLDTLALVQIRNTFNHADELAERKLSEARDRQAQLDEEARDRQIQLDKEAGILRQINALAEADMWRLINEHEARINISEVMQKIQDIPARKATDAEFDEMLDELYKP